MAFAYVDLLIIIPIVIGIVALVAYLSSRRMGKTVRCPECGNEFKRPLVPEKRSGLGFTLAPQIGDYTCPKCHYRGHAMDFQIKSTSETKTNA